MTFQTFFRPFSIVFLTIVSFVALKAQAPQVINYQAVVRDAAGEIVKNKAVNFRLSILDGGLSGTPQYVETQSKTTNQFGLVTFGIGQGSTVSGAMNAVTWSTGNKFFKVEFDINGGNNFSVMSTSQFLSVPYALYAANGGSAAAGWGLSGNTATSSNYLGTNNTQDLRFYTEGSQKMVLKPSGFMGLGTTNPEARLTVEGIGDGTGAVEDRIFAKFNNKSTSFASVSSLEMLAGSGSGSTMLSHHAPSYTVGTTEFSDYGQLWSSGKGLIIRASASSAANDKQGVIRFYTGFNPSTFDFANNNERMRITNNGNVGIGTKNPSHRLRVETESDYNTYVDRLQLQLHNRSTNNESFGGLGISAGNSGTNTWLEHLSSTYSIYQSSYPDFNDLGYLATNGSNGLTLFSSPNGSNSKIRFAVGVNSSNAPLTQMTLNQTGLGLGTQSPRAKIEVANGDVYLTDPTRGIILKSPNGNCWRVTVDNSGNLVRTQITCP